jgi:hypothetical protein
MLDQLLQQVMPMVLPKLQDMPAEKQSRMLRKLEHVLSMKFAMLVASTKLELGEDRLVMMLDISASGDTVLIPAIVGDGEKTYITRVFLDKAINLTALCSAVPLFSLIPPDLTVLETVEGETNLRNQVMEVLGKVADTCRPFAITAPELETVQETDVETEPAPVVLEREETIDELLEYIHEEWHIVDKQIATYTNMPDEPLRLLFLRDLIRDTRSALMSEDYDAIKIARDNLRTYKQSQA